MTHNYLPSVQEQYLRKLHGRGRTQRPLRRPDAEMMQRIREAFDPEALRTICLMTEDEFVQYGDFVKVAQEAPNDFYYFKDNGSKVLGVAHLDSCERDVMCEIANTADGPIVFSGSLDDRLGAYVILELLPKLGILCDWLLTTGEETGRSTAEFFTPPIMDDDQFKDYNWIIQFDRGGTDVVLYDYQTPSLVEMVEATGVPVGMGSFSDICKLEWLGCKGINWGVAYRDYHGPRAHAWLDETFMMVEAFTAFHATWHDTWLEHHEAPVREDSWVHYRDLGTDRYDGIMTLKGDRTKSRSIEDDELLIEGPGATCLGCFNPLEPDGFCFSCDDWEKRPRA